MVKRIYAPAARSDGFRVLVDRLWPRGFSKSDAQLDLWLLFPFQNSLNNLEVMSDGSITVIDLVKGGRVVGIIDTLKT